MQYTIPQLLSAIREIACKNEKRKAKRQTPAAVSPDIAAAKNEKIA